MANYWTFQSLDERIKDITQHSLIERRLIGTIESLESGLDWGQIIGDIVIPKLEIIGQRVSKTISLNDGSRNKNLPTLTSVRVLGNWIEFYDAGNPVFEKYYEISGISFALQSVRISGNDIHVNLKSLESSLSVFSFTEDNFLVLTNKGSGKTLTIKLDDTIDVVAQTTDHPVTNNVLRYEYRYTDAEIATIQTDFFADGAVIDAYIVIGNTVTDILPDMRGAIVSVRPANAAESAALGYPTEAEYIGYDDYIRRVNTVYNDELLKYWSIREDSVFVYGGGYTGDVILQYYAKLGKEKNTSSRLADYIPSTITADDNEWKLKKAVNEVTKNNRDVYINGICAHVFDLLRETEERKRFAIRLKGNIEMLNMSLSSARLGANTRGAALPPQHFGERN